MPLSVDSQRSDTACRLRARRNTDCSPLGPIWCSPATRTAGPHRASRRTVAHQLEPTYRSLGATDTACLRHAQRTCRPHCPCSSVPSSRNLRRRNASRRRAARRAV
eukprot:scaffold159502_cov33-Tisochrysis_lutea.AAC.3